MVYTPIGQRIARHRRTAAFRAIRAVAEISPIYTSAFRATTAITACGLGNDPVTVYAIYYRWAWEPAMPEQPKLTYFKEEKYLYNLILLI